MAQYSVGQRGRAVIGRSLRYGIITEIDWDSNNNVDAHDDLPDTYIFQADDLTLGRVFITNEQFLPIAPDVPVAPATEPERIPEPAPTRRARPIPAGNPTVTYTPVTVDFEASTWTHSFFNREILTETITEVNAPIDTRVPVLYTHNADIIPSDYTPLAGADITRNLYIFIIDMGDHNINLTPTLISNTHYEFLDNRGERWINNYEVNGVRNNMGAAFDTLGTRWIRLTDYMANPTAVQGLKFKSRKKLYRKRPIPEIKDEKHYASGKYIA